MQDDHGSFPLGPHHHSSQQHLRVSKPLTAVNSLGWIFSPQDSKRGVDPPNLESMKSTKQAMLLSIPERSESIFSPLFYNCSAPAVTLILTPLLLLLYYYHHCCYFNQANDNSLRFFVLHISFLPPRSSHLSQMKVIWTMKVWSLEVVPLVL